MREIVCRLNPEDAFNIKSSYKVVNLWSKNEYHYTFWSDNKRQLYQVMNLFSFPAIDLFNISLMVYYADRAVLRNEEDDAWTRSIKIYMPVLELDVWNSNKTLLENMLNFLSGDNWSFDFRARNINEIESSAQKGIDRRRKKINPDSICMLSGGLDSFIGAINLLERSNNICFVGHYGGGKGVSVYQNKINHILQEQYTLTKDYFFNFYAAPIIEGSKDDTTRTRSFMFFSHAIILASGMNKEIDLFIPENGLISLNIPMIINRIGSSSTRTTHPYYMKLLQQLIHNLNIRVNLHNPFQFNTKGEMIRDCLNPSFLNANIENTMSCSHPDLGRYDRNPAPSHCGTCLPCVIRRASIMSANVSDHSEYRNPNFNNDGMPTAKIELKSYRVGLEYFETNCNPLNIQKSGLIDNNINDYIGVYYRGMGELKNFIDTING